MSDSLDPYATLEPDALEETANLLRAANARVEEAGKQLEQLESAQQSMIRFLEHLIDLARKLKIEREAWKARADQIEVERNIWEAKAGELELKLQRAWRVAAELGVRTGEARCPNCGSGNVHVNAGDYGTGVTAPDGTEERHYQCCLKCGECGHYEEIVP